MTLGIVMGGLTRLVNVSLFMLEETKEKLGWFVFLLRFPKHKVIDHLTRAHYSYDFICLFLMTCPFNIKLHYFYADSKECSTNLIQHLGNMVISE